LGKAEAADMTDSLARVFDDRLNCVGPELSDLAKEILSARRSASTVETYRREWLRFVQWCSDYAVIGYPIPAEVLVAYLTWLCAEGYGRSTIRKTITVMSLAHDDKDNPCGDRIVRELVKGILRRDRRPTKKARPLSLPELIAICDKLTEQKTVQSARDRALISVGWMAALRASELVALNWRDVVDVEQGVELHIRESKTNKTGDAEIVALPLLSNRYHLICPVRNLRANKPITWRANDPDFPVFRSGQTEETLGARLNKRSVSRIIERSAELARLEGRFSSHCLRRGFATFAAGRGLGELQIMRHGRWKSSAVAAGYVERSKLWSDNPLSILLGDE
jgi:integrase